MQSMCLLQDSEDSPKKVPLANIRGRAAGNPILGGAPEFCGTLSTDGLIRIDCDIYPAHWQEIQLPEEVVLAWKEYRSKKSSRVVSEDVLMGFLQSNFVYAGVAG